MITAARPPMSARERLMGKSALLAVLCAEDLPTRDDLIATFDNPKMQKLSEEISTELSAMDAIAIGGQLAPIDLLRSVLAVLKRINSKSKAKPTLTASVR